MYTPYFLDASQIDYDRRARLLAEAFPALTLPAGANFTEKFTVNNFDMQTMQTHGWPAERDTSAWKHSDLRVVAYPYVYKLFNELVGKGELK